MASTPATSFSSDRDHDLSPDASSPPPLIASRRRSPRLKSLPSPTHTASGSEFDVQDIRVRGTTKTSHLPGHRSDSDIATSPYHHERYCPTIEDTDKSLNDDTKGLGDPEQAILAAYKVIWSGFCGLQPTEAFPTFHLGSQEAYQRLHDDLGAHPGLLEYFDTLRGDWNADTGDLTLRLMLGTAHEYFRAQCIDLAGKALDQLSKEYPDTLRPLRQMIKDSGSGPVGEPRRGKKASTFEKNPDGQWKWKGHRGPSVVFEVAYTQQEKALISTAREYLIKKPGVTVVIFDLDYNPPSRRAAQEHPNSASVSIWTSEVAYEIEEGQPTKVVNVSCVRDNTIFRDKGQAVDGVLDIPFRLFCPPKERSRIADELQDTCISLNFSDLARLVAEAENEEQLYEAARSPSPDVPVVTKFWDANGKQVSDLPYTSRSELKRQREDAEPGQPVKRAARAGRDDDTEPRRHSMQLRTSSRGRDESSSA